MVYVQSFHLSHLSPKYSHGTYKILLLSGTHAIVYDQFNDENSERKLVHPRGYYPYITQTFEIKSFFIIERESVFFKSAGIDSILDHSSAVCT